MTNRFALALVALAGLTAFAPAPFPRPGKKTSSALDLKFLQGSWKVLKSERTTDKRYHPTQTFTDQIRIQGNTWTFVRGSNGPQPGRLTSYRIEIDAAASPVRLRGYRPTDTKPYMVGILRKQADTVQILYGFSRPCPENFEEPPSGCWMLILQRPK